MRTKCTVFVLLLALLLSCAPLTIWAHWPFLAKYVCSLIATIAIGGIFLLSGEQVGYLAVRQVATRLNLTMDVVRSGVFDYNIGQRDGVDLETVSREEFLRKLSERSYGKWNEDGSLSKRKFGDS